MKVLITGCHGLLGQKLVALAPADAELFGLDLQQSSPILPPNHYSSLDFTKSDQLLSLVCGLKPAWIINAAAYTHVDGAETERELCWNVNVRGVENLVHAGRKVKAKIVHISTDYIFDGNNGPYSEEAFPNPIGYYGRSKLAAENVLLTSPVPSAIARTMVLYGLEMTGRDNFVTWLLKKLQAGDPVSIVTDQHGNTTLADELAAGCWQIVKQDFHGIVHIAGKEIVDRFTFAGQIARVFGLDGSLISPITTEQLEQQAPRPLNSGLVVDKALNELGLELSDVQQGLRKLKKQMQRRRNSYYLDRSGI